MAAPSIGIARVISREELQNVSMPRSPSAWRRVCRQLVLLAVLGAGLDLGTMRADGSKTLLDIWQDVQGYLSPDAMVKIRTTPRPDNPAAQREYDFCSAVVIMAQPAMSEDKLDAVVEMLEGLIAQNVGDEVNDAAHYLLGRIEQFYRRESDEVAAAEYYRDLAENAYSRQWGDLARVKLAILILYVLPVDSSAKRIAQVEQLLDGTTTPVTQRELHRLLGRAIMFYNFPPERALEHLLAADKVGGFSGALGADNLVQIGELAWDTGQVEMAQRYYERLRAEYPRDPRIFLMDQRMAGQPVPHRLKGIHGR